MKIYNFDRQSGELLGQGIADINPLDNENPLIPANSTAKTPIAPKTGQALVFRGESWTYIVDKRGEVFWTADGVETVIVSLGTVDKDLLSLKPVVREATITPSN